MDKSNNAMSLFQKLKRVLYLANVDIQNAGERSGVKLEPLNAGGHVQVDRRVPGSVCEPHDVGGNGYRICVPICDAAKIVSSRSDPIDGRRLGLRSSAGQP